LMPKRIRGGVLLVDTTYEMRWLNALSKTHYLHYKRLASTSKAKVYL
jgi:hypothetical protein